MDSRNFAIGVLSTTATILLVGVVLLYSRPDAVRADGMSVSGGGYVMTVGSLTQDNEEVVYVLDISTDKMLVYRFDGNRRQIEIVQGIDLTEAQRSPPAEPRTRQP